jgi:hypothetical protein
LREALVDLTVARNGFFALAVAPDVVPPAAAEKPPPAFGQTFLEIATFN